MFGNDSSSNPKPVMPKDYNENEFDFSGSFDSGEDFGGNNDFGNDGNF